MSDSKHLADKDDSIFPGNDQKKTADSGRPDISFGAAPAAPAPRPVQQPQKPVTNEPTAAPSQRPAASGGQQRPQRTEMPQSRPVQQTKPPQPNKTPSAAGTAAKTASGTAPQARNGQQAKKPEASGVQRPASGQPQRRPAGTSNTARKPVPDGKRPTQQTAGKPAGYTNGKPAGKPAGKTAGNPAGKTTERSSAKKPAAKKPDTSKASSGKKTSEGKKKKGSFTKKQALTIAGLIIILILILLLIVFLILHYYWSMTRKADGHTTSEQITYSDIDLSQADTLDKVAEDQKLKELSQKGTKISNKDVMNILLIGEDLRDTVGKDKASENLSEDGEGKASCNTDVMMIISVNTKDKTITMTSIMRDCYATFEDLNTPGWWWSDRINAAYWYGGVELTKSTIENYMNVKIDRYVLVNFNVFIDIVDALGGIEMDVTDDEANGYPDADPYGDNTRGMQNPLDEQNKYLHNKKGTDYLPSGGHYNLNGNQALAYSRIRHVGNSDYDRTMRQRKVITQMIKESRSMSLVDMDRLAKKIFPQIATDVTTTELAQLLVDMLEYRDYKIQEFRVPQDNTYYDAWINGMAVLSVDYEANAKLFRELVYGSTEIEEEKKDTSKPNIE